MGGGYTNGTVYISATKGHRELKLVSKDAMTIFYNHVIRHINKLTVLVLKYLRKLKIKEKNQWQTKGVYQ